MTVPPIDALYLARRNCRGLGLSGRVLNRFMLTWVKLWLDKDRSS